MQALIEVILPVFLIVGFGYAARWRDWISDDRVDGLMSFAQNFAVPMLLFAGIVRMDLGEHFQVPFLLSFYAGAFSGGLFAFVGARYLFKRALTDSVAIGFAGMFSNSLLLGVPITERAYGVEALVWNFAIISIHAPLLYGVGIAAMEIARVKGKGLSPLALLKQIGTSVLRNPLVLAIASGWVVNLLDIKVPAPIWDAVILLGGAGIPAALFGLGGVLLRYKPDGDMRLIFWTIFASLILHPVVTFVFGTQVFALAVEPLRSATIGAAMASGVNSYLFASIYGVGKRVAASVVLLGTAMSVVTIWVWLAVLP